MKAVCYIHSLRIRQALVIKEPLNLTTSTITNFYKIRHNSSHIDTPQSAQRSFRNVITRFRKVAYRIKFKRAFPNNPWVLINFVTSVRPSIRSTTNSRLRGLRSPKWRSTIQPLPRQKHTVSITNINQLELLHTRWRANEIYKHSLWVKFKVKRRQIIRQVHVI
jgi:hypothetical protein